MWVGPEIYQKLDIGRARDPKVEFIRKGYSFAKLARPHVIFKRAGSNVLV
jgi:hypothetical protein